MKHSLHFRTAGFTLLEIMLVVMIISLLAGSAIYMMKNNIGIAKHTRVETDILSITSGLNTYDAKIGRLPTTEEGLKALLNPPKGKLPQLIDKMPVDPYGREYHYVQPGTHNPRSFDLFSAGQDGIVGTVDDQGNWEVQ